MMIAHLLIIPSFSLYSSNYFYPHLRVSHDRVVALHRTVGPHSAAKKEVLPALTPVSPKDEEWVIRLRNTHTHLQRKRSLL